MLKSMGGGGGGGGSDDDTMPLSRYSALIKAHVVCIYLTDQAPIVL